MCTCVMCLRLRYSLMFVEIRNKVVVVVALEHEK